MNNRAADAGSRSSEREDGGEERGRQAGGANLQLVVLDAKARAFVVVQQAVLVSVGTEVDAAALDAQLFCTAAKHILAFGS